ncbi:hypothetical protein OG589_29690 [Sphaerisporangium sp. NBC_01403]|uniref:hypothetical protein n=1 Tax=Sphaerisporangium sp. NBC_01403 TaxID=2903599 RepID=UPI0032467F64
MVIRDEPPAGSVFPAKAGAYRLALAELSDILPGFRCRPLDRIRLTLKGPRTRFSRTVLLAPHMDVYAGRALVATVYVADPRRPRYRIVRCDGVVVSADMPGAAGHLAGLPAEAASESQRR